MGLDPYLLSELKHALNAIRLKAENVLDIGVIESIWNQVANSVKLMIMNGDASPN